MELKIFQKLKEAYDNSTHNYNAFEVCINSIPWESEFEADGELYYCYGDLIFTIQNINPFEEQWRPTATFTDGSVIKF